MTRLRTAAFPVLLAAAAAAGAFLRLDHLPSQILLDDEWHGLNQVVDAGLADLLGTMDGRDNSSLPLNVYHWALLHTAGWTEMTIRLPALLAGIASVALLPFLVRRHLGDRAALLFGLLLAIAPFAVFYSRFSRSYAFVLPLSFAAVLFARRWLESGARRDGRWFAFSAAAAAWFHPTAGIVAAAPFAAHFLRRPASAQSSGDGPSPGEVRRLAAFTAALLAPVAWLVLTAEGSLPWGEGSWSWSGLAGAASLLGGTASLPALALFAGLVGWGTARLRKRDPRLLLLFVVTLCLYAATLAVALPFGLENPVVLLRYVIVALPILLSVAALGLAGLTGPAVAEAGRGPGDRLRPVVGPAAASLAIAWLYLSGPFPGMFAAPSNFSGHSAYQGSYDPPARGVSEARHVYPGPSLPAGEIPPVYRLLREMPEVGTIVEYPFDVTNFNNLFYYYQFEHGKEVKAGYCPDRSLLGHDAELGSGGDVRGEGVHAGGESGVRMGLLSADQILSRVGDHTRLRFRNLVDITDPAAVAASGADAVVLHRSIDALRFLPDGHGRIRVRYRSVPEIAGRLREAFGPPLFEDDETVCFLLIK